MPSTATILLATVMIINKLSEACLINKTEAFASVSSQGDAVRVILHLKHGGLKGEVPEGWHRVTTVPASPASPRGQA